MSKPNCCGQPRGCPVWWGCGNPSPWSKPKPETKDDKD